MVQRRGPGGLFISLVLGLPLALSACGEGAAPASSTPTVDPIAVAKAQYCRDISNFNAQTQAAVNANDPTKEVAVILQFAPRFYADGKAYEAAGDSATGGALIAFSSDLEAIGRIANTGGDPTNAEHSVAADVTRLPKCP